MKEEELKVASKGKGGGPAKKGKNIMNGRALFKYNPDMFEDDENAADAATYVEEGEEEEKKESEKYDEGEKAEEAVVDKDLFAGETVEDDEDVDFD